MAKALPSQVVVADLKARTVYFLVLSSKPASLLSERRSAAPVKLGDRVDVVIHPQSVHAMMQYHDMSVVAQLGTPPIAHGLSWPERMSSGAQALDFTQLKALTFESMDAHGHPERFPGVHMAWDALRAPFGANVTEVFVELGAKNCVILPRMSSRLGIQRLHAWQR